MNGAAASGRERRVLDEAGGLSAMTGVMAVMLFLTVLAAAAGLAAGSAARQLDRQLAGRLTVQVVDADPARRETAAARALAALRTTPGVTQAVPVPRADVARLLGPFLGTDAADAELPVPALIDADLADDGDALAARVTAAVQAAVPAAAVDRHARWMAPVGRLLAGVRWGAAALVALMAAATGAVCVLAARGGLERHRATIEVMHMLGSTDVQVARLFQRRLALDAALGGGIGTAAALGLVALAGSEVRQLGSELLGGLTLSAGAWAGLALTPLLFVALASLAARAAVLAALRRTL